MQWQERKNEVDDNTVATQDTGQLCKTTDYMFVVMVMPHELWPSSFEQSSVQMGGFYQKVLRWATAGWLLY